MKQKAERGHRRRHRREDTERKKPRGSRAGKTQRDVEIEEI